MTGLEQDALDIVQGAIRALVIRLPLPHPPLRWRIRLAAMSKDSWSARCPQITFVVAGRWWRIFAGVTFRPDKPRLMSTAFYGHRLWRMRLWKTGPHDARVIGIQTRRVA